MCDLNEYDLSVVANVKLIDIFIHTLSYKINTINLYFWKNYA